IDAGRLQMVRSAVDPSRFAESDRPKRRVECRQQWNLPADSVVGLTAAMNYRLKGLTPLLHGVKALISLPEYQAARQPFRLLVAGSRRFQPFERQAQQLGIA